MSPIKCYDVASVIIDEASERFKPLWKINDERVDIFKQYCEVVDSLVIEFGGESLDVEINEVTLETTIVMECDEIIIESSNHIFYDLAERTVRYSFYASEDGSLAVKFVFPSLWDKV